ncbi:hypothetical protein NE237_018890 [Protea cynaroides]|uniref:Uncharacterized protein n=1 Tax=Protea cynaroides TaxID=273540 RepID=A0A9Q0KAY8_9MAGN|nr:hypothetical protein NE237_018890 [Protea cynaroides]
MEAEICRGEGRDSEFKIPTMSSEDLRAQKHGHQGIALGVFVHALLVFEIERILRPSDIGAMLVRSSSSKWSSLIKSTTLVSSFLKSSSVTDECSVGLDLNLVEENSNSHLLLRIQLKFRTVDD